MRGSIHSANYTPKSPCGKHGSGWKLDLASGDFEINSCAFGSASAAPERQMVSVEVASWSKHDLPKNADNLLQFLQVELQRVPEEYRHAAEFEEFDASYGDESFNARLFLSYSRLETEEELVDRLEKAKVAGTRTVRAGGCTTVIVDGVVRYRIGNLDAPLPEPEQPETFKVDGGQVYIGEAFIDEGSISTAHEFAVTMAKNANGQYVSTGLGLGIDPTWGETKDGQADMERAIEKGDAAEILRLLSSTITETRLGHDLRGEIAKIATPAETIRQVIREELRQGGMLHRG